MGGETPLEHHHIRSLEASLRVAEKKAETFEDQFESTCVDFTALKEKHEELESELNEREVKLDSAQQAVRDETKKVRELRRELTGRAEAKIRAEAHAKEVETELSVMQAGSSAMETEVARLSAEHEELSHKLDEATGSFSPYRSSDSQSEEDEKQMPEQFLPDC